MRVEFFIDPVSGWSWWTPALLVQDEARLDEERTEAWQRPAGQGLVLGAAGPGWRLVRGLRTGLVAELAPAPASPPGYLGAGHTPSPPQRLELVVLITGHPGRHGAQVPIWDVALRA